MNWRKPLIYLTLHFTGSKIPAILTEISLVERTPLSEKKHYQQKKLDKILNHAKNNVPHYSGLTTIKKAPILTKAVLRKAGKAMYSKDYQNRAFYFNTSGGSTGEPVKFIQDKLYSDWNIANKIWIKKKAGQDIGDRELRFWGSERDLLEGKETFKIRARNWLYNRREMNTFKMGPADMRRYVDEWNSFKPSWVESYVQSMFEFAKFVKENDLKVHSPKNGILTSAGTLYPHMKDLISEVFKCPVYNRYGSREVGDMACGKDELALSYWNHYLEVVDGKVLVTTLNNYSMPLIRYDIGDIVEMSESWGYLKKVKGRENSMIKLSSGRLIDTAAITSALYFDLDGEFYTSFSRYQFIQKKVDEFELRVVVNDINKWELERKKIHLLFLDILGKKSKINYNIVDEISCSANGKYEYVRSCLL